MFRSVFKTRRLATTPDGIAQAAAAIRTGELVAFPTETVYGLGGNALNAEAITRIFVAKGRPATDPLIVHIADRDGLALIVAPLPAALAAMVDRLSVAFWPGPLTLILPRASHVPSTVSAGLSTIAVRAPSHPIAQALIRAAQRPIAAPSANRFAHVSPTSAAHVLADLDGRIGWVLDDGSTPIGVESTIVDLTGDRPVLRRPGAIGAEALRVQLPDLMVLSSPPNQALSYTAAQVAPGQLSTHYAPNAPLTVYDGAPDAVQAALRQAIFIALDKYPPESIGLLIAAEDRMALADLIDGKPIMCLVLGSLADLDGVARALYNGLRALDEAGVAISMARTYPPDGIGLAIRDRLRRAAGGRVIAV